MGHTLTQWQVKVLGRLRDAIAGDADTSQVVDVGIKPAIVQYSIDRPYTAVTEAAGTGSSYLALPPGWTAGFSRLSGVEYPARQNPPEFVDNQCWSIVRSTTDATLEQILLLNGLTPTASEHVRFWFTAPWPFPTNDVDVDGSATVDMINDIAFEPVASLAAALVCDTLVVDSARRTSGTLASDFGIGDADPKDLVQSAKLLRGTYLRFLGVDPDAATVPGSRSGVPVSQPLDFDPQRDSMFHGGRR